MEEIEGVTDPLEQASRFSVKGLEYQDNGQLDEAQDCYLHALAIHRHLGSDRDVAGDLADIGLVYRLEGNLKKALECFEEALDIYEEGECWQEAAGVLFNMGFTYQDKSDTKKALEYLGSALDIFQGEGYEDEASQVRESIDIINTPKEEDDAI